MERRDVSVFDEQVVQRDAELAIDVWPIGPTRGLDDDRDTLIQASAVTLVFITVAAAYLGVLDAAFNWLVQRVL